MAGEGMCKGLKSPETGLLEILRNQRGYCDFLIPHSAEAGRAGTS